MRPLSAATLLALAGPAAAAEPPTFSRDVAPILFAHCAGCHRPDNVGPFPLLTYEDARKRAKLIARVTEMRVMPPWKPAEGHGEFKSPRTLTPGQVGVLREWADAGAPPGDPKEQPPVPPTKAGWQLGKPDLVLKMPRKFKIPATGPDVYWHFVFPLNLPKERYLRGIEVRPGNRRVAHHAVGILDTSGTARRLDAKNGGGGYPGVGGPGFLPAGFTPGYVPGQTPNFLDADTAITFGKSTDFVLQMHYHPTGKVEHDQTEVGLYFTDRKPARNPGILLMGSERIDIPAGEAAYRAADTFTLPTDYELRSVWAHLHLIGKRVHVWAELPGGGRRELLKIDDWDFNWQDTYAYATPLRLPRGTVLRAEFEWDNSADNPRNPNRPPRRVTLGENSDDEMAGLILGGMPVNPAEEWLAWAAVVGHYFEITGKGFKGTRAR